MMNKIYIILNCDDKEVLDITHFAFYANIIKFIYKLFLKNVYILPIDEKLLGESLCNALKVGDYDEK